jgi:hypothetical protein
VLRPIGPRKARPARHPGQALLKLKRFVAFRQKKGRTVRSTTFTHDLCQHVTYSARTVLVGEREQHRKAKLAMSISLTSNARAAASMRNNELSEGSSLSQGDSVALASSCEGKPARQWGVQPGPAGSVKRAPRPHRSLLCGRTYFGVAASNLIATSSVSSVDLLLTACM